MNLAQLAQLLNPVTHQLRTYYDGEIVAIAGTLDRALNVKLRITDREVRRRLVIRGALARVAGSGTLKIQREPEAEEIGMLRQLCGLYGGAMTWRDRQIAFFTYEISRAEKSKAYHAGKGADRTGSVTGRGWLHMPAG